MPLDQTNWKQDTETKPDVFSLEGLIAWLEKQPEETTYVWHNCRGGCLIGMYFTALGIQNKIFRPAYADLFYPRFPDGSYHRVCMTTPWTFGAALSRARALLAETRK